MPETIYIEDEFFEALKNIEDLAMPVLEPDEDYKKTLLKHKLTPSPIEKRRILAISNIFLGAANKRIVQIMEEESRKSRLIEETIGNVLIKTKNVGKKAVDKVAPSSKEFGTTAIIAAFGILGAAAALLANPLKHLYAKININEVLKEHITPSFGEPVFVKNTGKINAAINHIKGYSAHLMEKFFKVFKDVFTFTGKNNSDVMEEALTDIANQILLDYGPSITTQELEALILEELRRQMDAVGATTSYKFYTQKNWVPFDELSEEEEVQKFAWHYDYIKNEVYEEGTSVAIDIFNRFERSNVYGTIKQIMLSDENGIRAREDMIQGARRAMRRSVELQERRLYGAKESYTNITVKKEDFDFFKESGDEFVYDVLRYKEQFILGTMPTQFVWGQEEWNIGASFRRIMKSIYNLNEQARGQSSKRRGNLEVDFIYKPEASIYQSTKKEATFEEERWDFTTVPIFVPPKEELMDSFAGYIASSTNAIINSAQSLKGIKEIIDSHLKDEKEKSARRISST